MAANILRCIDLIGSGERYRLPSPAGGAKRGFAKRALRRCRRIGLQANPWGAERGLGMRGLAKPHAVLAIPLTPGPSPACGRGEERAKSLQ
jgi:hypothetical protein